MKRIIRRLHIVTLVLILLLSFIPSAMAEYRTMPVIRKNYSEIYVGFVKTDAYVYENPSEFSRTIALKKGFPVYVVGEYNDFYIVRNHNGAMGYMLRHEVTPVMPSGAEPFYKTYNPKWEVQRLGKNCLLMLPEGMRIHSKPDANSTYMNLTEDTPCRVIGKSGSYYLIVNMDRSAVAYFHPQALIDATTVGYGWTV